ncbi:ribonuclease H-like domain-containing protein, partial [Tanacetum coccineum]
SKLEYKFQDKEYSEDIFSSGSALEDFICVVFVPDRNIMGSNLKDIHLITKVDSEPPNGSKEDITNQCESEQALDVSAGLVPQGQKALDYDNSNPVSPRQNVVPTAEKAYSSQQGLEFLFSPLLEDYYNPTHGLAEENNNDQAPNASELKLLFHHHIAMLRTTGINPMIQPELEDLPKDNPKLQIAVLRMKKKCMDKGSKERSPPHNLRQKPSQYICCQNHKLIADIENDIMDPKTYDLTDVENTSEVDYLQFFDCQIPESPNDDGKDSLVEDGSLPHSDSSDSTQVQTPLLRKSDRQSKLPVRLNDYVLNSNVKYGIEKYVNYSKLDSVTLCFATTLNKSVEPSCLFEALSDPNWVEAMNNEIEALNRNNTWTICDLPIGRKPIGSKWIWKIKYKALGEIEIYKARLIAKGFSQREGFDYDETFSHVVNMVIARCLIGLAIVNNWPLYQLDVNNAFLYGDLIKDVYMTLPDGYNNKDKSKVYKLNKSLYGLKQAPRQWKAKLTTALAEHGFEQSKFDYSLYTKHNGDEFVTLLVYVDDIVITTNDDVRIKEFKLFLSTKFLIKDLGVLKYFLGIEVIENDIGQCISHKKYCHELLHEHGLLAARLVDIPLPKTSILSFDETNDDKYLSDFTTYQKLVGKLIYLTNTRHDISYVVHCLSQHMHSPLQSHFKAALRVLRYLKGSPGCRIQIYEHSDLKHKACSNADKAKYPKTKREKVLAGINKTMKVSFDLQTADIFTKSLGVVQHILCCKKLGMLDVFIGELGGKDLWRKIHVLKKGKKIQAHQPEGGC